MARSLNRVQLIGNLTRDPELRYTPQGTAVCTFGLATNRKWTMESGESREEAEFHRIVAWNKLAELCSQLLSKGRKVYVEGRLSTRTWTAQDGTQKTTTEVVIDDMIILDSRRDFAKDGGDLGQQTGGVVELKQSNEEGVSGEGEDHSVSKKSRRGPADKPEKTEEDVNPEDIPF
ncbi:single-stranded DNA-binding protein [Candidatus Parcubacteria bacterium]|nr:MAG: single-stranded DNA-binding protein [Candidatus Parcubacteria bacterium]